jgi:hypothetical protein
MKLLLWALVTAVVVTMVAGSAGADTVSCDGKRGWQRQLVQKTVADWFRGETDPDDLVYLVQAEHGIAACATRGTPPPRLHTPMLTRGFELEHLGAVLLAQELEWLGLMPAVEHGLAGGFFRVRVQPQPAPHKRGDF